MLWFIAMSNGYVSFNYIQKKAKHFSKEYKGSSSEPLLVTLSITSALLQCDYTRDQV